MNIDYWPDLTFLENFIWIKSKTAAGGHSKISNGHVSATRHPIHFMYVRPLYFSLRQLVYLTVDSVGKLETFMVPTQWYEEKEGKNCNHFI